MKSSKLDKMDMRAINFEKELLILLKKYNCELTNDINGLSLNMFGDNDDEINRFYSVDPFNYYHIKHIDDYSDTGDESYDLNELYIKEYLDDNPICNINNKVSLIFSHNKTKVNRLFDDIKERKRDNIISENKRCNYREIKLKNGEIYKWIYSIENIRGLRCSKCYVDKNINILLLNQIKTYLLCTNKDIVIF